MSKSLKRHNLPKLIQEEINNMNKPIYVKEIEFVEESFLQRSHFKAQMASLGRKN